MSPDEALLEGEGISKTFGGIVAVKNVSMDVKKGEIVGLIGPNGAGKTTFFNIVTGFLKPDKGQLKFQGERITGLSPNQICRKGIARTFQTVRPFRKGTVKENILVGALYGNSPRSLAHAVEMTSKVLDTVGLKAHKEALPDSLTLLGLKKLEVARALATGPKLLLLDEVTAGLDRSEANSMIDLIKTISSQAVSIVVVEHVMRVVMSLANRLIVLDHGEKIAEGKPSEVVKDENVVSAYLGEGYADDI
jgi:branched-chain amino acid transport system ATP-binding protein